MAVGLAFLVLLLGYAVVDALLRGGAWFKLPPAVSWVVVGALLLLAPWWSYASVSGGVTLGWFAGGLATVVAWNAATRDRDPVSGGPSGPARLALVAVAALATQSPACLLLAVAWLSGAFHFWQHHAAFPLRILQALTAFVTATGVLALWGKESALGATLAVVAPAALVMLLTVMLVSHYVITALAKMVLGPRPWSWVVHNRLHYLPAAAYSWGWGRFVDWPRYCRLVQLVRRVERPLQVVVFMLELCAPLALLDVRLGIALCVCFAAFHVGVFGLSGLLFWDWIVTDLALAWLLYRLPADVTALAFGPLPFALGCLALVVFPLRHRLWKPMPLGWFDSPLTQRVHWHVIGSSGRRYGLYNDFMCPHERLYGKVNGCFVVPHAVLTYHLGEVWKLELRDALVEAGPNRVKLDLVRQRFGIFPKSEVLTARHRRYLGAFFAALNRGAKKAVLPRWARWLKAPGDQLYYWGDLPAYRLQEPVVEVELVYREEFFDGGRLVRLVDEALLKFPVPQAVEKVAPELTPRQLDDYLLSLAAGRLIDVPGFSKDYLAADDGVEGPTVSRAS